MLNAESALAVRSIRCAKSQYDSWCWLSDPKSDSKIQRNPELDAVSKSIDEVIEPLLENAAAWDAKRAKLTSTVLPEVLLDINYSVRSLDSEVRNRLVAMVLLPIYRSLGTAELDEGFFEMRRTCLEAQVLLKLICVLGDDLSNRINEAQRHEMSPHCVLKRDLEIDLTRICNVISRSIGGYLSKDDEFSQDSIIQLRDEKSCRQIPEWAQPDLLWRLAGQLQYAGANLTLPRPWIDTPVPWQSVDRHWNELVERLAQAHGESAPNNEIDHCSSKQELSETKPAIEAGDSTKPRKQNTSRVLIAEVLGHNDPAYVSHLSKRIKTCHSSKRAVLTVAIQLRADGEPAGLVRVQPWQQDLINALHSSEDVGEVFAFLTADNKLLINMLDIERMDATELLRDSLQERLQPKDFGAEAKSTPIYYVGMAACGTPSPSLTAIDLIEPAIRCLSAAQLQPRSSIKSIEVY